MTIIGLLIALVVVCIAIWGARQTPAPFNFILWAFVVLALVLILLQVTGVLGGVNLQRHI